MTPKLEQMLGRVGALISSAAGILASRWKLLSALALTVFAVVTALVLLLPEQYDKEISLSVTPRIGEVQERLGQKVLPKKEQVSRTALAYVKNKRFGEAEVIPTYDPSVERIDVLLRSHDRDSLTGVARAVKDHLESRFREVNEEPLRAAIKSGIASTQGIIETNRSIIVQLDRQIEYNRRIEQTAADPAASAAASANIRNLEARREQPALLIEQKEQNLVYLEDALADPGPAADDAVEVVVSAESEVRQTSTSSSPVVAAALFALTAAVAAVMRVTNRPGGVRRTRTPTPAGSQESPS